MIVGWSETFICLVYSYRILQRDPYKEIMMAVAECKVEIVLC